MVKHNIVLPNAHLHKDWKSYVKTWFNQPGRKLRRRKTREKKAALIAPRPTSRLYPAVRCPTNRYNIRIRMGRGFTLEELKEAGLSATYARSIGISVDLRRKNRCEESLNLNVQRLNEYKSRLILFPSKTSKKKRPNISISEYKSAIQIKGNFMPIVQPKNEDTVRPLSSIDPEASAYKTMRLARSSAKLMGKKLKELKEKEANELLAKK